MAEIALPKSQELITELYLIPMGTLRLGASPYEPRNVLPLSSEPNTIGYQDEAIMADLESDFYNDVSTGGAYTTSTGTFEPSDVLAYCQTKSGNTFSEDETCYTSKYYFSSYRTGGINTFVNAKIDRISTSDTGWELEMTVEGGTDINHRLFTSGREFCLWATQWSDGQSGSPIFNGPALYVYIKYDGGRVTTREKGRTVLKVVCATIDHFLNIPQRKLDFFSKEQAIIERAAWQLDATGHNPVVDGDGNYLNDPDTGNPYGDPFQGFGAVIDTYNLDPTQPLAIPPCNESHLISHLNIPKAIRHVLRNHVKASRNSGQWAGLWTVTDIQIHDSQDKENALIYFSKEDGTVLGSIQSALKHGVWDFFATAHNALTFRKDWCADWQGGQLIGGDLSRPFPLIIVPGRSLMGQLTVSPGRSDTRIARVEVQGMPQLSAAEQDLTSLNYFTNFGQAVFPNVPLSDIAGGSIYTFTGYMGFHVYHQARSLFAQQTQETTASLTGYPFANVFGMFKNIVSIRGKSPQGEYDYTPGAMSELAAWVGAGLGDVYTSSTYTGFHYDTTIREYVNVPNPADGDGINYDYLGKRFKCEGVEISFTQLSENDPMLGYLTSSLSLKEIVYFSNLAAGGFDQSSYDPNQETYTGPNTKPGDWTIMAGNKGA